MIFAGQHLRDPVATLDRGWRASTQHELSLIADFYHLLTKPAGGPLISGLSSDEQWLPVSN